MIAAMMAVLVTVIMVVLAVPRMAVFMVVVVIASMIGLMTANLPNAQYVVQPWYEPEHRVRFPIALTGSYTTHCIDWQSASVTFRSFHGHYPEPPDPSHLICEWQYTNGYVPPQESNLCVVINLWLMEGLAPSDELDIEVTVTDFSSDIPEPCARSILVLLAVCVGMFNRHFASIADDRRCRLKPA